MGQGARNPCGFSDAAAAAGAPCLVELLWNEFDAGVIVFDIGKNTVWRNPAVDRLLRGEVTEITDGLLRDLFLSDPQLLGPDRERHLRELRLGPSLLLGYSIYRASELQFVVLVRDITEQRRMEVVAEAVNLTESLGFVFSGIRHELGNPVNSLKMALSVLQRNLALMGPEEVGAYLERMTADLARVEYLLASLKTYSLYDDPKVVPVELAPFLRGFADVVAEDLRRRGIDLELALSPDLPRASFDPRAMHHVLLNLVTNAAEAVEGREGARVTLGTEVEQSAVRLRVIDNGKGFSEAQLAELFRPFRSTKPRGTGLGLVIVRKMTLAMGGEISVESEPGRFTCVTLRFPQAQVGGGPR